MEYGGAPMVGSIGAAVNEQLGLRGQASPRFRFAEVSAASERHRA
jgi:hypothetical protein